MKFRFFPEINFRAKKYKKEHETGWRSREPAEKYSCSVRSFVHFCHQIMGRGLHGPPLMRGT